MIQMLLLALVLLALALALALLPLVLALAVVLALLLAKEPFEPSVAGEEVAAVVAAAVRSRQERWWVVAGCVWLVRHPACVLLPARDGQQRQGLRQRQRRRRGLQVRPDWRLIRDQ